MSSNVRTARACISPALLLFDQIRNLSFFALSFGEQGWRGGDCTCLPATWPWFDLGFVAMSELS